MEGRGSVSSYRDSTSPSPEASAEPRIQKSPSRTSSKLRVKPATIPKPFNLSLHSRGEERLKYNSGIKTKISQQEQCVREKKEMEEEEARKTIRRKQCFKANKIRSFKPTVILPSQRPLTYPESPRLAARRERRRRELRDQVEQEEEEEDEVEEERLDSVDSSDWSANDISYTEEWDGSHLSTSDTTPEDNTTETEYQNSSNTEKCKESKSEDMTWIFDLVAMVIYCLIIYFAAYVLIF